MDSMPRLTSFLFFFIILWLHFLCVASAAYAERRTYQVSSTPVGEKECRASIPNTLKLWVPKKKGFTEFASVCKHNTNAPISEKIDNTSALNPCVTGFSIDVFRAALKLLPFKVNELQFSPFTKDYDEILKDVRNNTAQLDAVVGDMTIKGYRASLVDFTMSYLDSSVYILVPTKYGTRKNMWIFLKPLSLNLWLGIIMAFIFVGVLIGTLEMRSNVTDTDFSGPLLQQLGMMIWYPVSMLVLPERRMVVSMWSKLVLVVWLYTAFVIMQSYTANFTTMLTINQLRPFFNQKGNYSVGYQKGSFVKTYLINDMKFDASRIIEYSTMEDYHEALSKGSDNGGVAAIYDELPYIKLFLHKYGSKYSVSGPINRTNGLGFAFPLKSCLAPLISKAIMNLTDEGKITELEQKYFGKEETSEVEISRLPEETPSLDAYNFIGIFIVAGSISIACLLCSEIWRTRQFVKRVSSTRIVNVIGDSPDHQYQLPSTTTSNSIIEIVCME